MARPPIRSLQQPDSGQFDLPFPEALPLPADSVTGVATGAAPGTAADLSAGTSADQPPDPRATPPTVSDGSRARSLRIGPRVLPYRFKRSARRTIGFAIDASGLTVTAPRWVTLADIETAIIAKQRWIFGKLADWQNRAEQRVLPRIAWGDGCTVPYLGRPLTVALAPSAEALHHDATLGTLALGLHANADAGQIKDRTQAWLQGEAKRLFGERLAVYAPLLGVQYTGYALSSAATRWGSCSTSGKIRLNWRLVHFPLAMIDYVVAHELAHLKEMNHGPRFWRTVESIFPEFREARDVLKRPPPEWMPLL